MPHCAAGGSPPAPGPDDGDGGAAPDALPDLANPDDHLTHDTQDPPAANAAPPTACAADSSADDAASSRQPPAAAAGPGDVLSGARHGPAKTTPAQATAAAAGCVSLVRWGCPPPLPLLVAGCSPSTMLCSMGWVIEVHSAAGVPCWQGHQSVSQCCSRLHTV